MDVASISVWKIKIYLPPGTICDSQAVISRYSVASLQMLWWLVPSLYRDVVIVWVESEII